MSLRFKILSPSGQLKCVIGAERSWKVADVKAAIEEHVGAPRSQQRLLCGSTELRDGQSIGSLFPDGNVTLTLDRLPRGREEWLDAVRRGAQTLGSAPPEVRADREVVLAA